MGQASCIPFPPCKCPPCPVGTRIRCAPNSDSRNANDILRQAIQRMSDAESDAEADAEADAEYESDEDDMESCLKTLQHRAVNSYAALPGEFDIAENIYVCDAQAAHASQNEVSDLPAIPVSTRIGYVPRSDSLATQPRFFGKH